jgi:hypothetical protein
MIAMVPACTQVIEGPNDRFSVAAHLFALGYLVAPVRYSPAERSNVYSSLRRDIWSADPMNATRFQRYREIFLNSCAAAVALDVLTGSTSRIVAVHYWHPVGEAWAASALPPTRARLHGIGGGAYHLYRHPGGRVPSSPRIVTPFPDAILIKIVGEFGAVPIWAGAYDECGEWPPIGALPTYDANWIELGIWR